MAEKKYHFHCNYDEKSMATEPIYLLSNEGEKSTPCSSPKHFLTHNHYDSYDAIKQLLGSEQEQKSYHGSNTVYSPVNPNTSIASDGNSQKFTRRSDICRQKVSLYPIIDPNLFKCVNNYPTTTYSSDTPPEN